MERLNFKQLPSGKHTKNYGKSPFLIGKSTINGPFSIAMLVYQRVSLVGVSAMGFECPRILSGRTSSPLVRWWQPSMMGIRKRRGWVRHSVASNISCFCQRKLDGDRHGLSENRVCIQNLMGVLESIFFQWRLFYGVLHFQSHPNQAKIRPTCSYKVVPQFLRWVGLWLGQL